MKTAFAALLTLLATAITAAPTLATRDFDDITISLINDQTGANAPATVCANGGNYGVFSLFASSDLNQNGHILVSSAQIVSNPSNIDFECDIVLPYEIVVGTLTNIHTFTEISAQDVTDADIVCHFT